MTHTQEMDIYMSGFERIQDDEDGTATVTPKEPGADGQQVGDSARKKPLCLPGLDQPAPDFDAMTTDGRKTLQDYKGKWLCLFSHPADFTPVCTTEFMAFAVNAGKFAELDCELLGLSIDSHFSHIAWKRNIHERFGIHIPFPVIADIDMKVAQAYGMIHEGASETTPVRALFLIDPQSILRAMIYYPMNNGRSVREVLRLLHSMQVSDEHGVATPEGWTPGDNVIVSPPVTSASAERREQMAKADPLYKYTDWYFCERPLHPPRPEQKNVPETAHETARAGDASAQIKTVG